MPMTWQQEQQCCHCQKPNIADEEDAN
jgi:hypothetical protein